jgi:hypothetical protein
MERKTLARTIRTLLARPSHRPAPAPFGAPHH